MDAGQFRILNPIGGHLGLPYAFAYFITDGMGAAQALGIYPQSFRSSIFLQKPLETVCVWALAADTDEEALHLFGSRARWKVDRNLDRIGPLFVHKDDPRD